MDERSELMSAMNKFVEKPWYCDRALSRCGLAYAAFLAVLVLLRWVN
jgi:hypothetical protein